MLKRTVSTAFVGLSVATLSPCTVAETNQEFYSRNGTTLPRAIASYPGGVPYGVSSDPRHAQYGFRPPGITAEVYPHLGMALLVNCRARC